MIRFWSILLAAALAMHAATAQANGRFPQTVNVHVQPGDDNVILLAATFGLLISRDGGDTFQWVCEEAIGYGGPYDPDYAPAADGTLFATTFEGLRISRDHGCTWETQTDLTGQWVEEVEIGPDGAVWAATASSTLPNDILVSANSGQSFQSTSVPDTEVFWKALRVAPGDAQRVYATGYKLAATGGTDGGAGTPQAVFLRSDDHGATWTQLPLDNVVLSAQAWFFVLGVGSDPDVVFANAVGVNGSLGDALYRSTDAGQTWTKVLDTANRIRAFVIRQNGDIIAGTETDGVYLSSDGGDNWNRDAVPQMMCVTENSTGLLLGCGANWEPDFAALATSQDGRAWQSMMRFSDIKSVLSCPAGTIQHDTCEVSRWPALCEMFECNKADAGVGDAGVDGGTVNGKGKRGCCDASPGTAQGHAVLAMLVMLILVSTGRRRRRQ